MSFLIKIAFLILLAPIIYVIRPWLFKPGQKERKTRFIILSLIHSILLTIAAISVLNLPVTILADEITFLGKNPVSENQEKKANQFINNNFLLIDNTYDKTLTANPGETAGDSTHLAVTDRKKLSKLFNKLADDSSNIDLVVCDIGFDDATNDDTLLSNSLNRLYMQNKLLMSVTGEDSRNKLFAFPDNICGDVKEETNEKLFTTHRLKRPLFYSLPYQVYIALNNISSSSHYFNLFLKEVDSSGNSKWKMNTYLPQFYVTDEYVLKSGFSQVTETTLNKSDTDDIQDNTFLLRSLGNAISKTGSEDFSDDIQQRKLTGKRNIILIGTFNGNEDVHRTAFAELHGPTIILNLIYSLQKQQNKLSLLLIVILMTGLFFISLRLFTTIFKNSLQDSLMRKEPHTGFWSLLGRFLFIEESHYCILLALVLVTYWCCDILINGLSLAIYFIAFETFAVHFGKSYIQSRIYLYKN